MEKEEINQDSVVLLSVTCYCQPVLAYCGVSFFQNLRKEVPEPEEGGKGAVAIGPGYRFRHSEDKGWDPRSASIDKADIPFVPRRDLMPTFVVSRRDRHLF